MAMHGCHAVLSGSCNYFVIQSRAFLHGALMLFTVGSGQVSSSLVTGVTFFSLWVHADCCYRRWMTKNVSKTFPCTM